MNEDSDQPVHPPSTARFLVNPSLDSLEAHAISEDSDQTAQRHSLVSLGSWHKSYCRFCSVPAYLASQHLLSQITLHLCYI